MPSSRKPDRQVQRKPRYERFQEEKQRAFSPQDTFAPVIHEASPHPYHAPVPPNYSKMDVRSTSNTSNISDVSMDEISAAQDSVFYYSDTSTDEREDHYFMPDASTGGPRSLLGSQKKSSSESVFRNLRANGTKASSVLKYSLNGSNAISSSPFDGNETAGSADASAPPTTNSIQQNLSKKNALKDWVANLAYSFRSPHINVHHKSAVSNRIGTTMHRSQISRGTTEYPHAATTSPAQSLDYSMSYAGSNDPDQRERTPLMQLDNTKIQAAYGSGGSDSGGWEKTGFNHRPTTTLKSKSTAASVAAFFLMDYEASRPPTLSLKFDTITPWQLRIYRIHFSWMWRLFGINIPIVVLFLAHSQSLLMTALMHTYTIIFFFIEVWMREQLYGLEPSSDRYHSERRLNRPLILFLLVLGLESWVWYIFPPNPQARAPALVSSIFKPVVFFYVSLKARHALEGLSRIAMIVARVLLIEMLLILAFASVGCQLYHNYESFKNLSSSWISLFECKPFSRLVSIVTKIEELSHIFLLVSTTVVNPSLWMPMYEVSQSNAAFFVFFIVVSVFYLHSLVLSVVFQTYIHAASEIHQRSVMDREEAIRRAFVVLLREESSEFISASSVRKTLHIVRPHYNSMKVRRRHI